MSKNIEKKIEKIEKKVAKKEKKEPRPRRAKARHIAAIKAGNYRSPGSGSSGTVLAGNQDRYFKRVFTKRDAAKLAWIRCVADPFTSPAVPIPPILAPGASTSCPRMYPITLKGFAVANSVGRVYIGLNADSWLPNPSSTVGTAPVPQFQYLGNSTANAGVRGYPVHYTTSLYTGAAALVAGSTGVSYPPSIATVASAVTALVFVQLPNNFIDVQLPGDSISGNAYQRYSCVAAGLRVRPTAPATGSLVMTGVLLMTQQILGDTVQTCATAASGTAPLGGVDAYAYMGGMGVTTPSSGFIVPPLTTELVGREEWDIAEWPKVGNSHSWLEAEAIPNQSCCFGMWTPNPTGASSVGNPQLSVIGAGLTQGQTVEFEAKLVYAYYGGVSYQENQTKLLPSVPSEDLMALGTAATPHMNMSNGAANVSGGRIAAQAVAQSAIDDGSVHPKAATDFIKSGAAVVEQVTGSTIGELIGEGLGFLAAALL